MVSTLVVRATRQTATGQSQWLPLGSHSHNSTEQTAQPKPDPTRHDSVTLSPPHRSHMQMPPFQADHAAPTRTSVNYTLVVPLEQQLPQLTSAATRVSESYILQLLPGILNLHLAASTRHLVASFQFNIKMLSHRPLCKGKMVIRLSHLHQIQA